MRILIQNLLEMIISLKDKLLPLMAVASKQNNRMTKRTLKNKRNNNKKQSVLKKNGSKTNVWPSPTAPTMQYIKEEEDGHDTVHWDVKIKTNNTVKSKKRKKKKKKAINPNLSNIYWSGSTASLYMN